MSNLRAQKFLEDSENVLIRVNIALGREPFVGSQTDTIEAKWIDSNHCSIPNYLGQVIAMQYRSPKTEKTDDIVLKRFLISDENGMRNTVILSDIMSRILSECKEAINEESFYSRGLYKSYLSELSKQQVLTVAPIYGHALAAGGHPVHQNIPDSFDLDETVSYKLGVSFRNMFNTARYYDFTVPAATSQGMTLKTLRDTPQWRIYSKALLGNLALKTKTRSEYEDAIKKIDSVFENRGFDGITNCFYLGMRRQGMRKDEYITSDYGVYAGGDYDVTISRAIQGRIRGIFPPSEFVKIYFKPFAEGIKKDLFTKAAACCVNMDYISCKVHIIALLSHTHKLYDEEGNYICFYDLSAMDTTTHEGFINNYHSFCKGVFPDFDDIEGDTVKNSDLIFPIKPGSTEMIRQQIKGRSTLSGQPDVTTKNNVCHLLAMTHCLSKVTGASQEDVLESLMTGNRLGGWEHPIYAHIHGDDTMLYFSSNIEDYRLYYSYMADLAFATSFENTPIFLKKTPAFRDIQDDREVSGIINSLSDLASEILSSVRSGAYEDRSGDRIISILQEEGLSVQTSDYNALYMGGLNASACSLVKNRWGEYVTKEPALFLMGLHDTAKMLNKEDVHGLWLRYWLFLYILVEESDLGEDSSLFDFNLGGAGAENIMELNDEYMENFYSWLTSSSLADALRERIIVLASSSATKARTIRNALERMYYGNGQDFADDVINTLFGSLELKMQDLGDSFDISNMSRDELLNLICELQGQIIDSQGIVPNMHDDLFKTASRIFSSIGNPLQHIK